MHNIKSIRDYIEALKEIGELHEINKSVDCNLEVGAIMKKVNDMKGPALLFNSIDGYPEGFRILGSPVGASNKKGRLYSRIALSLRLPVDTSVFDIIEKLSHINENPLIPPRIVETALCKENILTGDKINLFSLPAPYLHEGDGGRYIGTWPIVITKTPDGKWVNWGMYRIMVHDEKTLGGPVIPTQHIGLHFAEWKKIQKPMPFAIAFGTDPLTPLVASMAIPEGVSEVDIVGGYMGEPVDIVKCETVDLYAPASAEIVIEGYISINETKEEGPFTEYTGFISSTKKSWPIFEVTAITHRNNPILPVVCTGEPVEDHLCMSVSLAADALNLLRKNNIPVTSTYIPPVSALHLMIVSVDKKKYKGQDFIQDIGNIIWSNKVGTFLPKIIVVDNDIDPTDLSSIMWCLATKCHPEKGIVFFRNTKVITLSPYLYPDEKKSGISTTVIYDCTWPSQWAEEFVPKRGSFESLWPKEIQKKVLDNWNEYGLDKIL
jgi:4-hydroxy-3-polyprenylbenzoate decarboxylase